MWESQSPLDTCMHTQGRKYFWQSGRNTVHASSKASNSAGVNGPADKDWAHTEGERAWQLHIINESRQQPDTYGEVLLQLLGRGSTNNDAVALFTRQQ